MANEIKKNGRIKEKYKILKDRAREICEENFNAELRSRQVLSMGMAMAEELVALERRIEELEK